MEDLIKWGLVGLGGYLLYQQFGGGASAPAQAPVAPSTAAQQTLVYLQSLGPGPVQAAAQSAGVQPGQLQTWSQWNWYLGQVSGVNVMGDDSGALFARQLPSSDPNALMSLAVFWAAVMGWAQALALGSGSVVTSPATGAGLSGLGYRDAGAQFATPPMAGAGRFDMNDEAWA